MELMIACSTTTAPKRIAFYFGSSMNSKINNLINSIQNENKPDNLFFKVSILHFAISVTQHHYVIKCWGF